MNLIAVTGVAPRSSGREGFVCVWLVPESDTADRDDCASCFQELVAFPQAASNFLRALMIALRARAFFGTQAAAGISAIP